VMIFSSIAKQQPITSVLAALPKNVSEKGSTQKNGTHL